MTEVLRHLEEVGVIPVIAVERVEQAVPLADALLQGGLPVAEITFRTAVAAEVIALLHEKRPELLVGAGTVLTTTQLEQAYAAGATFALAPGVDSDLIADANRIGLSFCPGFMTPTDLQAGIKTGALVFKFFPAVQAGGLIMLRAILAPFAHLQPRIIPTGGITTSDLAEWLSEPAVLAVGGTWIASRRSIAEEDWRGIKERAKEAVSIANEVRLRKKMV